VTREAERAEAERVKAVKLLALKNWLVKVWIVTDWLVKDVVWTDSDSTCDADREPQVTVPLVSIADAMSAVAVTFPRTSKFLLVRRFPLNVRLMDTSPV
jgi:hypothetical protein